jgi:glucose/mannose-6-phosphate isomerase
MMSEVIKKFADQFSYNPIIEGGEIKKYKKYILSGMGGSHLAADIARIYDPTIPIIIRSDYNLPKQLKEDDLKDALFIASSYSGNTEEVISALEMAMEKKIDCSIITIGGELLRIAKENNLPYIQMPDEGMQPRSALGFSLRALFKMLREEEALEKSSELKDALKPEELEEKGKEMADKIKNHVPVIYTSQSNKAIAYNWKIKLNETGKIPAFYNVFPELNHNEMTSFDVKEKSKHLSEIFYFITIKDGDDHPKVSKRMDAMTKLYKDKGLKSEIIELEGNNKFEKIFNSLILADWTAFYTAENYGLESELVPMVEEFKKMIK